MFAPGGGVHLSPDAEGTHDRLTAAAADPYRVHVRLLTRASGCLCRKDGRFQGLAWRVSRKYFVDACVLYKLQELCVIWCQCYTDNLTNILHLSPHLPSPPADSLVVRVR